VGAAVDLLAREMSETFHDMRSRLDGLTEDEFFWEPVRGSWTVFRDERGRWDHHYDEPDPSPPRSRRSPGGSRTSRCAR
jgi:hypothetical protein